MRPADHSRIWFAEENSRKDLRRSALPKEQVAWYGVRHEDLRWRIGSLPKHGHPKQRRPSGAPAVETRSLPPTAASGLARYYQVRRTKSREKPAAAHFDRQKM